MDTRSFDAGTGTTISMRSKEDAMDYRYFPEPDLQPVTIAKEHIQQISANMPPLPSALYKKYTEHLKLSDYDAQILTDSKEIALYFEKVLEYTDQPKAAANWIMGEVKSWMNQNARHIDEFPLKPASIAQLIDIVKSDKVSHTVAAQKIFPILVENPEKTPEAIAEANNWLQVGDEEFILSLVKLAVEQNPAQVSKYKAGNKGVVGFFMGEVMKHSQGKADPRTASKLVIEILDKL
jgi:aspartyl-tRNA(Asn)/glutamyl-tRNA(Gln) amidotransferase subunit B